MGNTCCGGKAPTAEKSNEVQKVDYAFFDSLPSGVQEVTVHHVYDGDTLTISEQNRARVRLLGIDAPELKEKEPYAKEAADYVKGMCPPGTKVWLRVSPTEKKDRHNRLLAFVFVANPAAGKPGFICINIALLQRGLATFYEPGGSVEHKDQLLKAEQVAISARLNIWKNMNFQKQVYTTPNGIAFHKSDCLAIQKVRPQNLHKQSVGDALHKGYSPCRECKPLG
jgi:endonuclease YncB( thermonuclease family)